MTKYNLKFFYPNYFSNRAISYACLSMAKNMNSTVFDVTVMGTASAKEARIALYKDAIPSALRGIAYRIFSADKLKKISEYRFEKTTSKGDIVYLWPGASVQLFIKLKRKGCIIVRENINTHNGYAKKLLDYEYSKCGIIDDYVIPSEKIQEELEIQKYTDVVFSPSDIVSKSLQEYGVMPSSIITASYGLKGSELLNDTNTRCYNDNNYVTAVFVGRICVRKGVHLLLEAWSKGNINGRLIMVGTIDNNIKNAVNAYLSESIQHISYTNDLAAIYSNADFFILPSIEEGSPLVTYLSLGAGLPSIVSPMGGGGIISEKEGIIIDPHDQDAFIDALRLLATDGSLRKRIGENARRKAQDYTWDKVGKRRAKALEVKLYALNI